MALPPLLPASFRGVPFAVLQNELGGGRRQVVHQFPGRDDPWTEDLGRQARTFGFQGFLVAGDRLYAGGPVAVQRALLLAALERSGSGLLTHPTLGLVQVCVQRFRLGEDLSGATYSDVQIDFVEAGKQLFPTILSASSGLLSAANLSQLAIVADVGRAIVLATNGGGARGDLAVTSGQWSDQILGMRNDAAALSRLTAQLAGPFGRYQAGGNAGVAGDGDLSGTSVAELAAAAAAQRATITSAATAVDATLAALTVTATEADIISAIAALVDALAAACADPVDALRLLARLLGFAPIGPEASSAMGSSISSAFRLASATALARTAARYQPSSYDDAAQRIVVVAEALDAAALEAADRGWDASFQSLRTLRTQAVQDLRARGGSLAPIRQWTFGRSLPALALAQRLYRDPARAEQLVGQLPTVPSPLFMPASFPALAA